MTNGTGSGKPLDEYVEAAVQRLLTENAEVAEQGLTVVRREHTLLLCGEVASPQRRDEILRLVTEHFPDVTLTADIGVTRAQEPSEVEELP
jgi:hypothetical protein